VTVAYDGAAALAEIQRTQPDAALLDIGMPGLSGYEVARAVRADAVVGRLTLVAITGWGQPADREKVFAAGFDHHWVKPVDLDKALAFLAQLKS
jgi:CheY-like chemotaxis protein